MTVKEKILNLLADCGTMTEAEIRDELNISHGTFFTKKEELLDEGKVQQFKLGRATVYQTTLEERAKIKGGTTTDEVEQTKKNEAKSTENKKPLEPVCGASANSGTIEKIGENAAVVGVGVAKTMELKAELTKEKLETLETGAFSEERLVKGMEHDRITGVYAEIGDWIDEIIGENGATETATNLDNTQIVVTYDDGAQQVYTLADVPGGVEVL